MSAVTKEELYRLIDELSDSQRATAHRLLQGLRAGESPTSWYILENAPLDDEPDTDEERAGAAGAWAEYQRGEALSAEEAKRLLLP